MEKAISLLLALVLCLSLCACGNSNNGSNVPKTGIPQVIYPDSTGDKIEFDDMVLVEDENVKISLVEFYTEKMNMIDGVREEKCATLKIENKTDLMLGVDLRAYIDNEEVTVVSMTSNTVEPGRVTRYSATYEYGAYPNTTPIESLDKMYGLEWSANLWFGAGTPDFFDYDIEFSMNGGSNADAATEPAVEGLSIRNGVHFGNSMDEVAAKEQHFEIDYESAGEGGYISAQAMDANRETATFDGVEDAYLFYYFDAQSTGLEQVFVMFGHGSDRLSMLNTYEGFLKLYFERYGIQLTDDQMQYIPIDTIAYEYATTHYEDSQMEKHNRWLLNDADGYVILDVTTSLIFGDSYYTFVGMRHVTAEEITAAGGNLSAIYQ